jgi:hypothetical protein
MDFTFDLWNGILRASCKGIKNTCQNTFEPLFGLLEKRFEEH